ncbi:cytochrome P450 [Streptomyces sp. NPDC048650]|uniref:cytochrome P450 n=1 Tax=Streptomyces sp. NPDC048650 TaxID=3365583 RepID=UPI00371DB175
MTSDSSTSEVTPPDASAGTGATARPYPFSTATGLGMDPLYGYLRERERIARVRMPYGGEAWMVTRHADAKLVLSDPRFSMAAGAGKDVPRPTEQLLEPGGLVAMDPPEHTRLRRLAGAAFTHRRVEGMRPSVAALSERLVDEMTARGPSSDLLEAIALPVSIGVICKLLGVDYEDRHVFQRFSEALLSTALPPEEVRRAGEEFVGYLAELVAERREQPTDDLLGAMVQARDDEDRLSENELYMLGAGLLVGGYETTATQIGNFTYLLLRDRRLYASLVADPGLIQGAVEELLRFTPLTTVDGYARIALEDVMVGDTLIRAGDAVFTSVAAANLDPEVFPDPDRLDFTRERNPHLGFGHGIHYCMGAPLARLEIQVVLQVLTRRLPSLRLAVPAADVRWQPGLLLRVPERLPVTW